MSDSGASVVIACWAEGPLLREAVESALRQEPRPAEVLVVNDASVDPPTNAVCRELDRVPGVRVIWQERNAGLGAARNVAFGQARGDHLVPLDADDLLPPGALAAIGRAFASGPDVEFVAGRYLRLDRGPRGGRVVDSGEPDLARMLAPRPLWVGSAWTLNGQAPLRRALWERAGGYDTSFRGASDLDDLEFWVRAIAASRGHRRVPDVLYVWRRYLGRKFGTVDPLAWERVVTKHRETYERLGLGWRAHELLLLASKRRGDRAAAAEHEKALLRELRRGHFRASTLLALAVPGGVLRRARRPGPRPAGQVPR